jgi:nucleotide-binding universal stress UspA family protein
MFSTIVHPTDFSEASGPALATAQELAKTLSARLIVCFVAHPPLVASGDKLTDPKTNATRDIADELETLQPDDSAVERELRIVITEQSTRVKTLLGFLEEMECDLLILGMHKRAGIAGWFSHSITEEVVRLAKCPVMVVKPQDEKDNAGQAATSDSTAGTATPKD